MVGGTDAFALLVVHVGVGDTAAKAASTYTKSMRCAAVRLRVAESGTTGACGRWAKAAADGARDTRSPGLRRAQAFTELLRRYLNSGGRPGGGL